MTVSDTAFESRTAMPLPERLIMGAAGLFCFFPLWDFFIRPGGDPFQLGLLPFWIIALGGIGIGIPMLAGAFLGGEGVVRLDAGTRLLTRSIRSPLLPREQRYRFEDIQRVAVAENSWSDGPASYDLVLVLNGRRKPLVLRNFAREEDAESALAALETLLGRRPA